MGQSFRVISILLVLLILFIGIVMPSAAQYDQDDWDHAICAKFSLNVGDLGGIGQYVVFFFYQEDYFLTVPIEFAEPNETLVFYRIIAPRTEMQVASPNGVAIAFVLETGEFFKGAFGQAKIEILPMDTGCLGAATDGRLNRFEQQMLAVIYPDEANGYDIWKIDPATSDGTFDYNVSRATVDDGLAAANASGSTQLIGSGATSSLYALSNGECLLTSPNAGGEPQNFIFFCASVQ